MKKKMLAFKNISSSKGASNLLCTFCIFTSVCLNNLVCGSFPKAQNVSWVSFNFKTLLTWTPKPTNYSYTVEFSPIGKDKERNPHCIRSMETECDLTADLKDLKATYRADVLSEPMRDETTDLIEFPYTTSGNFCPYEDTIIGKPEFKIEVSKDHRKITLYVTDILTAIFNEENQRLSIRDIFKDDLQYKVTYRRAESTGKKTEYSKSNTIELNNLDRGESYCFTVQAYIPSRSQDKQLGEPARDQCSPGDKTILEEYSLSAIVGAIAIIILVIAVVVTVIVVCCKRRQRAKNGEKEAMPLSGV
ncbi:coagulation factor III, tissue factor a [Chanos chanos]|uniref:Tissue factor n=1 Tax=Chanos chanos TaxID=29144 RepID=A0A6J2V205_CHACN|nr:tissue factor-like [Chanos chanos]